MTLISDNNSSKIEKPSPQPFNFPSANISSKRSPILGDIIFPVSTVRRNHFYPIVEKKRKIKRIAVVGFIADHPVRCHRNEPRIDRFFHQFYFVGRSAFNASGDRKTRAVCNGHEFRAFAPFGFTHGRPPFFAGTKVPSINDSVTSISPRSSRSFAKACITFLKTPFRFQSWNLRWQV